MLLFALSYLGGVLTILSPCILPVIPFVFTRADRSFLRGTLPLLGGMVIAFAAVATLGAVAGNWAVTANQYGRVAAMILLALFGVVLLWPALGEWLSRPFVALGNRMSRPGREDSIFSSAILGVATGLLWTPCAGPILGLILTGAALQGPSAQTTLLLVAYAAGAATSLAVVLFAGGRVFSALKRGLGAEEWIRRGLGVLVLCGVAVVLMGWDTGFLTNLSGANTTFLEQGLLERFKAGSGPASAISTPSAPANPSAQASAQGAAQESAQGSDSGLPIEGQFPSLDGAITWINSPPLTPEALRGKVVLIDFWTYSCINCLRTLPYTRAWAAKYKDHGLVVIGVHTPEFAFEQDVGNVTRAVHELNIAYPVAVDSHYAIWRAFQNMFWPAHYLIDAKGLIRGHHFGEGGYAETEEEIQKLLIEAGYTNVPGGVVDPESKGIEAQAAMTDIQSPETYIGFVRTNNFDSPGGMHGGGAASYSVPAALDLNHWALGGNWTVGEEFATLNRPLGRIAFQFHARDLHLVLGPTKDGKPVRFRVTIDGKPPGDNHGVDTDSDGNGTVTEQRLYQLVRLSGPVSDHTFAIEFLDPGVQAYSFTFG